MAPLLPKMAIVSIDVPQDSLSQSGGESEYRSRYQLVAVPCGRLDDGRGGPGVYTPSNEPHVVIRIGPNPDGCPGADPGQNI